MTKRFKLDVHTHTIASGHAYSTVDENVRFAAEQGLELVGISDHAPKMPGGTHNFYFLNLRIIPQTLHGIRVIKGAEVNIMDNQGRLDLKKGLLKRLDYAIASLHVPCIEPMDMEESTQTILNVIANPFINIIGHPCDPRYPLDIPAVVTSARDNNTLLEINNSSLDPGGSRAGGEREILELIRECRRQGLPIILGSDAHFHTRVGGFDNILPLLDEADMPDELIINTSTEAFLDFISIKNDISRKKEGE